MPQPDAVERAFAGIAEGIVRRILEGQAVAAIADDDLRRQEAAERAVLVGRVEAVPLMRLVADVAHAEDVGDVGDLHGDAARHVEVAPHAEALAAERHPVAELGDFGEPRQGRQRRQCGHRAFRHGTFPCLLLPCVSG